MDESREALARHRIEVEKSDGTYRQLTDILDDLHGKWDNLTNAEQQNLGVALAGKHQLDKFLSLMNSYDTALEARTTSEKSAGSAMKENIQYQASMEAQLNELKVAWTEFTVAVGEAGLENLVRGLMDAGVELLGLLTKIVEKFGLLPPLIMASAGAYALFSEAGKKAFLGVGDALETFATSLAVNNGKVGKYASTVDKLGGKLKGLGTIGRIATGGLVSIGVALAGMGLEHLFNKFMDFRRAKETFEKEQNLIAENYEKEKDSIGELIDEYEKLLDIKESVGLSAEQEERSVEITEELIALMPSLEDHLIAKKGHLEENLAIAKEELGVYKEIAEAQALDNTTSFAERYKEAKKDYDTKKNVVDSYKSEANRLTGFLYNPTITHSVEDRDRLLNDIEANNELHKAGQKTKERYADKLTNMYANQVIDGIISGGEKVSKQQRKIIKDIFKDGVDSELVESMDMSADDLELYLLSLSDSIKQALKGDEKALKKAEKQFENIGINGEEAFKKIKKGAEKTGDTIEEEAKKAKSVTDEFIESLKNGYDAVKSIGKLAGIGNEENKVNKGLIAEYELLANTQNRSREEEEKLIAIRSELVKRFPDLVQGQEAHIDMIYEQIEADELLADATEDFVENRLNAEQKLTYEQAIQEKVRLENSRKHLAFWRRLLEEELSKENPNMAYIESYTRGIKESTEEVRKNQKALNERIRDIKSTRNEEEDQIDRIEEMNRALEDLEEVTEDARKERSKYVEGSKKWLEAVGKEIQATKDQIEELRKQKKELNEMPDKVVTKIETQREETGESENSYSPTNSGNSNFDANQEFDLSDLDRSDNHVKEFVKKMLPHALRLEAEKGVPASAIIAQTAQETQWGKYAKENAYFGMKAGKNYKGKTFESRTWEDNNGNGMKDKGEEIVQTFRAYESIYESMLDWYENLERLAPAHGYDKVINAKTPHEFFKAMGDSDYATDANYGEDLLGVYNTQNVGYAVDKASKKYINQAIGETISNAFDKEEIKKYVKGDIEGVNEVILSRLAKMAKDYGETITVTSGYRSIAEQEKLWNKYAEKYPDPEVRDDYVARPGSSAHNYGIAVDIGNSIEGNRWYRNLSEEERVKYGLHTPLNYEGERHHFEPIETKSGDRGGDLFSQVRDSLFSEKAHGITGYEGSLSVHDRKESNNRRPLANENRLTEEERNKQSDKVNERLEALLEKMPEYIRTIIQGLINDQQKEADKIDKEIQKEKEMMDRYSVGSEEYNNHMNNIVELEKEKKSLLEKQKEETIVEFPEEIRKRLGDEYAKEYYNESHEDMVKTRNSALELEIKQSENDIFDASNKVVESKEKEIDDAISNEEDQLDNTLDKLNDLAVGTDAYNSKLKEANKHVGNIVKKYEEMKEFYLLQAKNPELTPKQQDYYEDRAKEMDSKIKDLQNKSEDLSQKFVDSELKNADDNLEKVGSRIDYLTNALSAYKEGSQAYLAVHQELNKARLEELDKYQDKLSMIKDLHQMDNLTKKQQKELQKIYNKTAREYRDAMLEIRKANNEARQSALEVYEDIKDKMIDKIKEQAEDERDSIEKNRKYAIRAIEDEMEEERRAHDEKMDQYDDEVDKINEVTNEKIASLDREASKRSHDNNLEELYERRAELKEEYDKYALDSTRKGERERERIKEELSDIDKKIEDENYNYKNEVAKNALKDQARFMTDEVEQRREKDQEIFESTIDRLEKEKRATQDSYDERLESLEDSTEKQIKEIEQHTLDTKDVIKGVFDFLEDNSSLLGDHITNTIGKALREIEAQMLNIDAMELNVEGDLAGSEVGSIVSNALAGSNLSDEQFRVLKAKYLYETAKEQAIEDGIDLSKGETQAMKDARSMRGDSDYAKGQTFSEAINSLPSDIKNAVKDAIVNGGSNPTVKIEEETTTEQESSSQEEGTEKKTEKKTVTINDLLSLDTGGYTGDDEGLAMLHKKELVLNQMDTSNILKAIEMVRDISIGNLMNSIKMPKFSFPKEEKSQSSNNEVNMTVNIENMSGGEEGFDEFMKHVSKNLKGKGLSFGL